MPGGQEDVLGGAGVLTAPVLLLSALQSGMIFESWTIQLLILSLRLRSTAGITVIPTAGFTALLVHLGDRPPEADAIRP